MAISKINFHIHSTGSDGKLTPEEVVKEAIKADLSYICFTDHYPEPKEINRTRETKDFHSNEYLQEIKRLQEKYKDKIDISLGVEFDWFEFNHDNLKKLTTKINYDYIMCSVHYLPFNGKFHSFFWGPDGHEKLVNFINENGGIEKFVRDYYQQIRLMVKSKLFDCVGHLDLVNMNNPNSILFSEESNWYKEEVLKTLDEIKKNKMIIEINTRGFKRNIKQQFPSFWIIKEARKRNIPITLGTDAHRTGEIIEDLDKAYELAKKAGYKEIVRFKARKMISIPI